MRISIRDLNPSLSLKIAGTEPWLARLYADFPLAEAPLTGQLEVTYDDGAGTVAVTGHVDYQPTLECARCAKGIPWAFSLDVDAQFVAAELKPQDKELNLSESDLDTYYLEDDAVDLEQLLNDVVQTAVPARAVKSNEDETQCLVCEEDLTTTRLYSSDPTVADAKPESPFAALKGLKVPH